MTAYGEAKRGREAKKIKSTTTKPSTKDLLEIALLIVIPISPKCLSVSPGA
jgi:hypothetical protein